MDPSLTPVYLVTGSRGYGALAAVRAWASALPTDAVLIAGGARGVDTAAADAFCAAHSQAQCEVARAEWARFGRNAGLRRNAAMVQRVVALQAAGHPVFVVAFWDGQSKGTRHTIDTARAAGLPVQILYPPTRT